MLHREQLIAGLRIGLERTPDVRAAWLGGADATGRVDAVSDIDLMVIAAPRCVASAICAIDETLTPLAKVGVRYRLPSPTWHGFEQGFCQFEDAPEFLMLDWLVIEQGVAHPWFEVERHGTPRVLFDKDSDITKGHVDRAAIDAAIKEKVAGLRVKYPLFRHMASKAADRGQPPDAVYFYHSMTLRSLVDMLRAVHCPDRHDYGFRYLEADLPGEAYDAVCRLCYPSGPGAIALMQREADRLFAETLAAWDRANPA